MPKNERPFSEGSAPQTGRRAKGDKRERIIQAATEVFAKNGFYATRVSEIAKAAGVADGTIYLYFKNKDDVLVSIFEDRIKQLLDVLKDELRSQDSDEDKLRRLIEVQLSGLEGSRDLAEVITVNLRQSSRLLKEYAKPLFTEYLELLTTIVAGGQKRGAFRPDLNPRVVARGLFGALDGLALTWALGEASTPERLRRDANHIASVFISGLKVEGGSDPAP